MSAIIEAQGLVRHFPAGGGLFARAGAVRAVDGASLRVEEGATFAIVGESGCGKSTLARRLIEPTAGEIVFDGRCACPRARTGGVARARGRALSGLRREVQFIFQDPFPSLNPRLSAGRMVGGPLEVHAPRMGRAGRRAGVADLLARVGLRPEHAGRYVHEFSGGQRQRIGIARALASRPRVMIGNEPVSALDVGVQAQVVNLLADLGRDLGLTLILIAHDIAVIRHMSGRVAVMYLGRIVEQGPVDAVLGDARHPYTRALLDAVPDVDGRGASRAGIEGEMPSPTDPPPGCAFHTRGPPRARSAARQSRRLRARGTPCPVVSGLRSGEGRAVPPATAARQELCRRAAAGAEIAPAARLDAMTEGEGTT